MPMPAYKPDPRTEQRLRDLMAADVPVWRIAEVLDIAEMTLRRHHANVFTEVNRGTGIKPFVPSPTDRQKVKALASVGVSQQDIAKVIGVGVGTLTTHFREELALSEIEANSKVAAKIFSMAMGPNDGKNTFLAAKFWAAARMGWKEVVRNEQTGADGGAIRTENQVVVILPDNGRDKNIDIDGDVFEASVLPAIKDETENIET